nr:uncharacterized protein LOC109190975 isoform X4 [Ipomoea batatas]
MLLTIACTLRTQRYMHESSSEFLFSINKRVLVQYLACQVNLLVLTALIYVYYIFYCKGAVILISLYPFPFSFLFCPFELFNMLPGKVDIKLSIDIPESFELVEPLNESCIWRQARGAATVVSEAERISTSEKVCAAQQWYDELDHRTFWESEVESNKEVHSSTEPSVEVLSSSPSEVVPEGKVLVDCCINTSPGTSEVIISAALYLKLRKTADSGMDSREQKAAKIADSLDPTRRVSKDLLVSYLLASKRDLEGLVVTRPLQVRLKFECPNHLTSEDNSKEIIITDSSINVSVSLLNP